ncbi:MAG: hypothetical protein WA799_00920 [Nitrosotalea sp.]
MKIAEFALVCAIFFFLNGVVVVLLYAVSELSVAEVLDYLLSLGTAEGVAIVGYHFFKHRFEDFVDWIEGKDDEEIFFSKRKVEELKRLLRKQK